MYELDSFTIIFGTFLTWGIGLTPPLVIRYAALNRPMGKWPAIGVCAFLWFVNIILFSALGSQSKTHTALTFVAFVSYWLLRKKGTAKEQAKHRESINETSGDGTTPLMGAAMLGKIKKVKELISAGANIDASDERGWTSLMYAASRNEIEVVDLLLRNGANPSLRNNENQTAVDIAQSKDNIEAVAVIQNHASVDNTPNEKLQRDAAQAARP
ncbi:MAG: ankyrin repeat domain-containing protein [Bacteroidetes bacterium]|nr:ankyrin repeat domain-containing protein [Pseudomonadota bacterium]MBS1939997.1 ankyrin repeat domain-containing protein [Bacteroidota bacterium]